MGHRVIQHAASSGQLAARGQRSEDRGQTTASQMVNLSNSQMVMKGFNDKLTI